MTEMSHMPTSSFVESSAALLQAVANEKRLLILNILSSGEISVGPLSELLGLSQSALSQHLSKLRKAGLVIWRREATTVFYRCDSRAVLMLLGTLDNLFATNSKRCSAA
jgi:ArsR family transcriptional regulator, virulence genes transcriptional regulator